MKQSKAKNIDTNHYAIVCNFSLTHFVYFAVFGLPFCPLNKYLDSHRGENDNVG